MDTANPLANAVPGHMLERRRLDLNASAEGIFQQEAQQQNYANHGDHCCNHEIAQPGALNLEQQAEPDRYNASQDDSKPHGRRYLRAAELQTPLSLPSGCIHLGQHVAEDFLLCWAAYAQTLNGGYQSVEIHLRLWAILPLGHRLPLLGGNGLRILNHQVADLVLRGRAERAAKLHEIMEA